MGTCRECGGAGVIERDYSHSASEEPDTREEPCRECQPEADE